MDTEDGKVQDIMWEVDEQTKLSAQYKLKDKVWVLENYNIAEDLNQTLHQGTK